MKRFECMLSHSTERCAAVIITNAETLGKGVRVRIRGIDWEVKAAIPASTNKVQFGDIIHEVKK